MMNAEKGKECKELPQRRYDPVEWIPKVEALIERSAKDIDYTRDVLKVSKPLAVEDCAELTLDMFKEKYESKCQPVLIKRIPEVHEWSAMKEWDIHTTDKDSYFFKEPICNLKFRISDTQGGPGYNTMPEYLSYMRKQSEKGDHQHISPRYLFDTLKNSKINEPICSCYKIPPYFPEDFFSFLGLDRPSYRWLLIGPKRSGTFIHIDPWGTSAWNTSIQGRKRWILFPERSSEKLLRGLEYEETGEDFKDDFKDLDSSLWFETVLPRIIERESKLPLPSDDVSIKKSRQRLGMVEFIQEPGDTIYLPGGWWHAVMNLDDTLAVTQNYANDANFHKVWKQVRVASKYVHDFQDGLEDNGRSDLLKRAEDMDKEDGFVLKERWCPIEGLFEEEGNEVETSGGEEIYSESDMEEED